MNVGRRGMVLGILVTGCLTGCALGPDYKRPPVSPPETFRFQTTPGETASLADAPWWEAFGDPALKSLIQEALAGNYNVRIAAARVQQARAQAAGAKAPLFPPLRGALPANYTARSAPARVQQARAQAAVAKSPFFPQLGYNAAAAQSKGL